MIADAMRKLQQKDLRWADDHLSWTPFHPGFWVRRRIEGAIVSQCKLAHGVLLDVGCGQKPYEKLFAKYTDHYIGMEYSATAGYRGNSAEVYGDAAAIPLSAGSVDTILCTEVLEHVPDPDRVISEIARVLRPGGIAICTAPFFYPVHDRFDFFRYSPDGVATIMQRHGFEVQEVMPLSGSGVTLAIMFNLFWFDIGFMWTRWLYPIGLVLRPLLLLLACCVNAGGWIFEKLIPSSQMSFNHLTIARRRDSRVDVPLLNQKRLQSHRSSTPGRCQSSNASSGNVPCIDTRDRS